MLRTVTLNERIGDLIIVTRGLEAGERVIVEGLQKVRPGMRVKPEAAAPPGTSVPPAAGTATPPSPAAGVGTPAAAPPAPSTAKPQGGGG